MSGTFYGTDYSWLACDGQRLVGWFCLNMSGPVPDALCTEPDAMLEHEKRLGEWVRSTGLGFEFGKGDAMWRDAAATGVCPFDFNDREQRYRIVVPPKSPLTLDQLPDSVAEVVVVQLPTADFTSGVVTPSDVAAATLL